MKFRLPVLVALSFLAVPCLVSATNYYVDTSSLGGSCSDSGSGTALSTPFCTVQKAASTTSAGDTVFIRGGTYREQVNIANSGSAGSPITFQPYNNETAVISGADITSSWSPLSNDETTSASSVFADGFETNDNTFAAYTPSVDAGNTLTIQSGVKDNGNYSLAATYGGTNRNARLTKTAIATTSSDEYVRFFFRINSAYDITANDTGQTIMMTRSNSLARNRVLLLQNGSNQFYLQGTGINPGTNGSVTLGTSAAGSIVPDTWYNVEIRYKGGDASTGGAEIWLDGVSLGSNYTWNTSTSSIDRLEIGGNSQTTGTPASGSALYIDDVKMSNSAIGAFSGGSPNQYKTSLSWTPNLVAENGTTLSTTTLSSLAPGTWYWDSSGGTLYVQTTGSVNPSTVTLDIARRGNGFTLIGKSYITFDSLSVKFANLNSGPLYGGSYNYTNGGIVAASSSNITIKNMTISDNYGSGIAFINTSTSTIATSTFNRNYRSFGGAIRLEAGSNNNVINGNTINGTGLSSGNGIVLCGDEGCQLSGNHFNTIRNNTFYNLYDSCTYISSLSTNNIFENNLCGLTFKHLNSSGGNAGGTGIHVSRGSNDAIIRNNVFYDNEGASISVQSDDINGVDVPTSGAQVYNNTVYNGVTSQTGNLGAITVQGTTTGVVVKNNIVFNSYLYSLRVGDSSTSTVVLDNNLFYSTRVSATNLVRWHTTSYSTLSAYQTATGQDAHSLSADPLFTNAPSHDFTLTSASPAYNAGQALGLVLFDYAGVARPQDSTYDLGAYEKAYTAPVVSTSGGGGGGGGVIGGPLAVGFINALQDFFFPKTSSTTVATSTATTTPKQTAGSLLESQIQSILSVLTSFGVDPIVLQNVEASLRGTVRAPAQTSTVSSGTFTRDLELGDTGEDVRALQQYLNAHGFTLANFGPGSQGSETTMFGNATAYQLKQFQKANDITPVSGYFGPKTRALIQP